MVNDRSMQQLNAHKLRIDMTTDEVHELPPCSVQAPQRCSVFDRDRTRDRVDMNRVRRGIRIVGTRLDIGLW